jgi:hypothetical protein
MNESEFKLCVLLAVKLLNEKCISIASGEVGATGFEVTVCEALKDSAKIMGISAQPLHVGGRKFPDIIFEGTQFGVEVKTSKQGWSCLGNSVLASTRVDGVDRIELVFGSGSSPVIVRSADYKDCVESVQVTHSPRYILNMDLVDGVGYFSGTSFTFEQILNAPDPISLVVEEARLRIGDGEWLWWMGNRNDSSSAPIVIRKWSKLTDSEQASLIAQTFAYFPEILSPGGADYDRVGLWLFTEKSVINTSLRDVFTAGGKVSLVTDNCTIDSVPRILGVLNSNLAGIRAEIKKCTPEDWARWHEGSPEQYASYADRFTCWRTKILPLIKSLANKTTNGADEYRANCIQTYLEKIELA